jgi:hypothetical protein
MLACCKPSLGFLTVALASYGKGRQYMEGKEISPHEIKVYLALKSNSGKWLTNAEISNEVTDIAPRTVRAHTLRLAKLGILDQAEVFPANRYRFSERGEKRNETYTIRLKQAAEIMGL